MDQKTIKILGGVIAGFAAFIFIIFLVSSCSKSSYTFEKLEGKMLSIAKNYYKNNDDKLPKQDHETRIITLKEMINDGLIDELSELFDSEEVKCDGSITVTNNNGFYLYTPSLSCKKGNDLYTTSLLKDKMIESSTVTTGVGLYEVGEKYIFKGEVKDNYIKLGDDIYRVIRINEDGTIRVLKDVGYRRIIWDNRYNEDYHSNIGINEYIFNHINSRIKDTVEETYKTYPEGAKAYIVTSDVCVGKRTAADVTKDGSSECSLKLTNQQFTLISTYEYLQASLDESCNETIDNTCRNYNWLGTYDTTIWTITGDSEYSKYVYVISNKLEQHSCSSSGLFNPVFNIDEKTPYMGGSGTVEDPYIIEIED